MIASDILGLKVLQGILEQITCSMISHSNTLSLQTVKRTDHLQVERRADPVGVRIDQLTDHIGSLTCSTFGHGERSHLQIRRRQNLVDQVFGALVGKELGRLVMRETTSCLVKVIQAEATLGVLLVALWAGCCRSPESSPTYLGGN